MSVDEILFAIVRDIRDARASHVPHVRAVGESARMRRIEIATCEALHARTPKPPLPPDRTHADALAYVGRPHEGGVTLGRSLNAACSALAALGVEMPGMADELRFLAQEHR